MAEINKVELQTMIRKAIEANNNDLLKNFQELKQASNISDSDLVEILQIKIDEFLATINKERVVGLFKDELDLRVKNFETCLKQNNDLLKEIHLKSAPAEMAGQIRSLWDKMAILHADIKTLKNEFNDKFTSKFIETVEDEDLRDLYLQSGLKISNIMAEFNVEHTQAHNYAQGKVKDLSTRSKLKTYYTEAIRKGLNLS